MNTLTEVQDRLASFRADGSALSGELASLADDLSRWMVEVGRFQEALRVALREPPPEPPAAEPDASMAEAEAQALEDANASTGSEVAVEESQPAAPAESGSRGKMFVSSTTGGASEARAQPPPHPVPPGDARSSAEEDEKLLASLDPQTATAIRVRRRLVGNSKSVRELLEEVRSARPESPAPADKKKKWWS